MQSVLSIPGGEEHVDLAAAPSLSNGQAGGGDSPGLFVLPATLADDEKGQFGEGTVIVETMRHYGIAGGRCAEIGAFNGLQFSNTLALRRAGWHALLVECNPEMLEKCRALDEPRTTVMDLTVTPENVEWALGMYGDLDVLSIDIDGMDYHVWKALEKCRPKIVVVEVTDSMAPFENDNYVPPMGEPVETAEYHDGRLWYRQASRKAMTALARSKGYRPVAMTRTNVVYVRGDVADSRPVKLNLGGGFTFFPGQTLVDAMLGDIVYPLAWADKSVSEIRASHVLEHFSHRETYTVLAEWKRVLECGGKLRVAVPNGEWLLKNREQVPAPLWEAYLFGGHTDENDKHGAFFTEQKLRMMLARMGMDAIGHWKADLNDCSALPVSLNMEGKRRGFVVKEKYRTIAVLSQPRHAPTDAMISVHRGLRKLGDHAPQEHPIDMVYCGGAFWEKYLTKGIESALKHCERGDYLLFADYDGVFKDTDVEAMIKYMQANPDVSAAFAVQASRHNDKALSQYDNIDYSGEASEVVYGHFGMTAVRAEVFEFLPHPWLMSFPNGNWKEEGNCDADILFWRILAEHGHKVMQLNKIQVGHMVECVKWMGEKGTILQPIQHYNKLGRPAQAVFNPIAAKADAAREQAMEKADEHKDVPKPANPIVLKGD